MLGGVLQGITKQFMTKALAPQRTYNWDIFLPDIEGTMGVLVGMCCQEIAFSDFVINSETVRYGGFSSKFPALQDINTFSMTFLKPSPDIVSSYFYAWKEKNIDSKGYYHVKSDYAKSMKVYFYDTTGIPMYTVELANVYPLSVMSYNLSYQAESIVMINIQMSVDRVGIGGFESNQFDYIQSDELQSISSVQNSVSLKGNQSSSNNIATQITTNARYIPGISMPSTIAGAANLGPLLNAAIQIGTNLGSQVIGTIVDKGSGVIGNILSKPNVSVEVPNATQVLGATSSEISNSLSSAYFTPWNDQLSLKPDYNPELSTITGQSANQAALTSIGDAIPVQTQFVDKTLEFEIPG